MIGSGPTVPDPSTLADARAIVARFKLDLPDAVARALNDPANESPKPGDPAFAGSEFHLVARPADAFRRRRGGGRGGRLRVRLARRAARRRGARGRGRARAAARANCRPQAAAP